MNKDYTIPEPPEGMINNPDTKTYNMIAKGLIKTGGFCPCVPKHLHNEITRCPCLDARVEKNCKCNLFIKA